MRSSFVATGRFIISYSSTLVDMKTDPGNIHCHILPELVLNILRIRSAYFLYTYTFFLKQAVRGKFARTRPSILSASDLLLCSMKSSSAPWWSEERERPQGSWHTWSPGKRNCPASREKDAAWKQDNKSSATASSASWQPVAQSGTPWRQSQQKGRFGQPRSSRNDSKEGGQISARSRSPQKYHRAHVRTDGDTDNVKVDDRVKEVKAKMDLMNEPHLKDEEQFSAFLEMSAISDFPKKLSPEEFGAIDADKRTMLHLIGLYQFYFGTQFISNADKRQAMLKKEQQFEHKFWQTRVCFRTSWRHKAFWTHVFNMHDCSEGQNLQTMSKKLAFPDGFEFTPWPSRWDRYLNNAESDIWMYQLFSRQHVPPIPCSDHPVEYIRVVAGRPMMILSPSLARFLSLSLAIFCDV